MTISFIISEFLAFLRKQASSSLFGGLMLFFLVVSRYVEIPGLYRYDFLFLAALATQAALIIARLETKREVFAIVVFHLLAMGMEIFKTAPSVGSWTYPEPAFFAVATVPLFTGFLYSSVGSYMARSWRINRFQFVNFPNPVVLASVGALIYANFFTNHYVPDVRWAILVLLVIIFWKTKLRVELTNRVWVFHPLASNALLAFFVWIAEQIGTFARAWVYPSQAELWVPVSFHMFTSWYMLLVFSFIIIALINGLRYEAPALEK